MPQKSSFAKELAWPQAVTEDCSPVPAAADLAYFVHFASRNTIPARLRREPLCQRGLT